MMIVYAVEHTSCIHESAYGVVSLHFKEEDADKVASEYLHNAYLNHLEDTSEWGIEAMSEKDYNRFAAVRVEEYEIE